MEEEKKQSSRMVEWQSPTAEVKHGPLTEVKRGPLTEVKRSPRTEVKQSPLTADIEQSEVKQSPLTEVKQSSRTEVKQSPLTEVKQSSLMEVKQGPRMKVKQSPQTEVKQSPPTEVKQGPLMEVLVPLAEGLAVERLYISAERELLQRLNTELHAGAAKLAQGAWATSRSKWHLRVLERALQDGQTLTLECYQRAVCLDDCTATFVDAHHRLSSLTPAYGHFLSTLRSHPELLASFLTPASASSSALTDPAHEELLQTAFMSLYGSALLPRDLSLVSRLLLALLRREETRGGQRRGRSASAASASSVDTTAEDRGLRMFKMRAARTAGNAGERSDADDDTDDDRPPGREGKASGRGPGDLGKPSSGGGGQSGEESATAERVAATRRGSNRGAGAVGFAPGVAELFADRGGGGGVADGCRSPLFLALLRTLLGELVDGVAFLTAALRPPLVALLADVAEIAEIADDDDADAVVPALATCVDGVLRSLADNSSAFPAGLRRILRDVGDVIAGNAGNAGNSDGNADGNAAGGGSVVRQRRRHGALAALLFGEFVVPAIVTPDVWGIVDAGLVSDAARTALRKVANAVFKLSTVAAATEEGRVGHTLCHFEMGRLRDFLEDVLSDRGNWETPTVASGAEDHLCRTSVLITMSQLLGLVDFAWLALESGGAAVAAAEPGDDSDDDDGVAAVWNALRGLPRRPPLRSRSPSAGAVSSSSLSLAGGGGGGASTPPERRRVGSGGGGSTPPERRRGGSSGSGGGSTPPERRRGGSGGDAKMSGTSPGGTPSTKRRLLSLGKAKHKHSLVSLVPADLRDAPIDLLAEEVLVVPLEGATVATLGMKSEAQILAAEAASEGATEERPREPGGEEETSSRETEREEEMEEELREAPVTGSQSTLSDSGVSGVSSSEVSDARSEISTGDLNAGKNLATRPLRVCSAPVMRPSTRLKLFDEGQSSSSSPPSTRDHDPSSSDVPTPTPSSSSSSAVTRRAVSDASWNRPGNRTAMFVDPEAMLLLVSGAPGAAGTAVIAAAASSAPRAAPGLPELSRSPESIPDLGDFTLLTLEDSGKSTSSEQEDRAANDDEKLEKSRPWWKKISSKPKGSSGSKKKEKPVSPAKVAVPVGKDVAAASKLDPDPEEILDKYRSLQQHSPCTTLNHHHHHHPLAASTRVCAGVDVTDGRGGRATVRLAQTHVQRPEGEAASCAELRCPRCVCRHPQRSRWTLPGRPG
ncbi:uncharacterized protein LOC144740944 isoform X2 [Lampetra planeri]